MGFDYTPEWKRPERSVAVMPRPRGWQQVGQLLIPPAPAARSRVVAALSDWSLTGFTVNPPSPVPKVGDDVAVDVYGTVNDINGSWPDRWMILILAASVNPDGSLGTGDNLYTSELQTSAVHSALAPSIVIGGPASDHWHAILSSAGGKMPNRSITVMVKVFADHNDTDPWDWNLWSM